MTDNLSDFYKTLYIRATVPGFVSSR